MAFAAAQVFSLDPGAFAQASQACVSGVDLFFKDKPDANVNRSGIQSPGVTVFLAPVGNGVPTSRGFEFCPSVRVDHADINAPNSTHHLIATRFEFDTPVTLDTGKQYAIVIKYDGGEDFDLWYDRSGWQIETDLQGDTTDISPGVKDPRIGKFFAWNQNPGLIAAGSSQANLGYFVIDSNAASFGTSGSGYWTEDAGATLAFRVYTARWKIQGNTTPVSSNVNATSTVATTLANGAVRFLMPARRHEFVVFDQNQSSNSGVLAGELVYQNTVSYPGGTSNTTRLSVVAGSNLVTYANGSTVNFSTLLNMGGPDKEWVVLLSRDHNGAGLDRVFVGQVTNVVSNTSIRLSQSVNFSNAACEFMRAPVAAVDQFLSSARVFGTLGAAVVLVDSSANSSVRFVNDSVTSLSVNAGGTGYANTDYVVVGGFESVSGKVIGGYSAKANLVTNSTGGIVSVYLSNIGAGFVNTGAITYSVLNSSALASVGTGATFASNTGCTIKSEHLGLTGGGGYFLGCKLIDFRVGEEFPQLVVDNPAGTFYTAYQRLPYYRNDDAAVLGGAVTYCDADGAWDEIQIKDQVLREPWDLTKARAIPSWSNELVAPYANGSSSGGLGGSTSGNAVPLTSNASVLVFDCGSNTDFNAIKVRGGQTQISFFQYIINDDYTNEHTDRGNAWAKGVEGKFALANGTFAEDIRVFATVHRPAGTNVVAFARVYNSHDPEAIDDKDWTMLQLNVGNSVFSNPKDTSDLIELTWGFQAYPNTGNVLTGVATTTLNSYNVAGSNTTWNTDLSGNDVVVVYSALFPDHYQVAVVNSVTNATFLSLRSPIANDSLVGTGFLIKKVLYPHQCFTNWLGDNVARYYNKSLVEFDTFDVCQVKLVYTGNSSTVVPFADDARVVALTA